MVRTRSYDRFRSIHVAVASLKLGFEFHFKVRQIDQVPAREFPSCVLNVATALCRRVLRRLGSASTERGGYRFMFEPGDEMDRVIADFVGPHLWFEIERTKGTVPASNCIKLWIEIEHAPTGKLDNSQIGITGSLNFAVARFRKIAAQAR